MSKNAYILEAFRQFDSLVEEDTEFEREEMPVYNADAEKIHDFLDVAGDDSDIDIIDLEAEAEEDLKQSYIGSIILDCNVCHSNLFVNKDEISVTDEGAVNPELECPYCMSNEGYTIVGEVQPYSEYAGAQAEASEAGIDVEDMPIENEESEEVEDDSIEESLELDGEPELRGVTSLHGRDDKRGVEEIRGTANTELSGTDDLRESYDDGILEEGLINKDEYASEMEKLGRDAANNKVKENEFEYAQDVLDRQLQECGDSKKPIEESIEDVVVNTEDETMTMSTKEDGGVVVETSPKTEEEFIDEPIAEEPAEEFAPDEEVIGDVSDEEVDEIELNSEVDALEDEDIDTLNEPEDVDVDEFDEESFDELGESYLREHYDNVDGFRTVNAKVFDNSLIIEGIIRFNSGTSKGTSFVFEAANASKDEILFEGYNSQISRGKKTFKLNCSLNEGCIKPEKMTYNYMAKNELNESVRVNGTVKVK